MNDAPVTDVINLLHVLATTTITDHTGTINFRQLQCWFAWVANQADVMDVILSAQMRFISVLIN